jgi:hypothetical protein
MPEWPTVRWWQRTALPQLLGIALAAINDDRLYRCLDRMLPYKQAIEDRIAGVGQSLLVQSYRYLLYDLTSTYFEGQMESNPKALRGYSGNHRPRCKQVTVGAVADREGYRVGYEVPAGNVRDHKTAEGMPERLGSRFGLADRTLCMDRGMVRPASNVFGSPRCDMSWPVAGTRRSDFRKTGAAWSLADPARRPGHRRECVVEVQEPGTIPGRGCAQKEKGIQNRMRSKLKAHLESLENSVPKDGWSIRRRSTGVSDQFWRAIRGCRAVCVCVCAPRGTSRPCRSHGGERVREPEAGSETAPGGALACPAGDRGTGAASGRGVLAAHQRSRNRRGTGMGGL